MNCFLHRENLRDWSFHQKLILELFQHCYVLQENEKLVESTIETNVLQAAGTNALVAQMQMRVIIQAITNIHLWYIDKKLWST